LFYYIISITFEKTVREMVFSPELGMWVSTFILIPIGIFLTYKAGNDSMRISPHFYLKITRFFRRKSKEQ
ncbi:MAG TPA: YjgP/YjgQ family permease, partial [Bacteroidales bacterium]|nr:YjgP/YjgQ family permease [Bacteroidales bacterium]